MTQALWNDTDSRWVSRYWKRRPQLTEARSLTSNLPQAPRTHIHLCFERTLTHFLLQWVPYFLWHLSMTTIPFARPLWIFSTFSLPCKMVHWLPLPYRGTRYRRRISFSFQVASNGMHGSWDSSKVWTCALLPKSWVRSRHSSSSYWSLTRDSATDGDQLGETTMCRLTFQALDLWLSLGRFWLRTLLNLSVGCSFWACLSSNWSGLWICRERMTSPRIFGALNTLLTGCGPFWYSCWRI